VKIYHAMCSPCSRTHQTRLEWGSASRCGITFLCVSKPRLFRKKQKKSEIFLLWIGLDMNTGKKISRVINPYIAHENATYNKPLLSVYERFNNPLQSVGVGLGKNEEKDITHHTHTLLPSTMVLIELFHHC
jgi:hypothetical protein